MTWLTRAVTWLTRAVTWPTRTVTWLTRPVTWPGPAYGASLNSDFRFERGGGGEGGAGGFDQMADLTTSFDHLI